MGHHPSGQTCLHSLMFEARGVTFLHLLYARTLICARFLWYKKALWVHSELDAIWSCSLPTLTLFGDSTRTGTMYADIVLFVFMCLTASHADHHHQPCRKNLQMLLFPEAFLNGEFETFSALEVCLNETFLSDSHNMSGLMNVVSLFLCCCGALSIPLVILAF